ncbi:MAG: M24 family metallopeptidase [Candidatus Anstonellaceae archaeon]
MDEIPLRRKKLFSGARFSSVLLYNGDAAHLPSPSFVYFSGCRVDGCYLVLKRNGGVLLSHKMNYERAKAESFYPVKMLGKDAASDLKKALGRGKIGFAANEMPAARFLALKKKLKTELVDATGRIAAIRAEKSAGETAKIAASAKIARKILESIVPWEYRTENELASHLKIAALAAGCEVSFEPIVASGKNSRFPHHQPTNAPLGDFVLVDFGVKLEGHCSDLTRCYFRSANGAKKERDAYEKCKRVFSELFASLGSCKNSRDVAVLSDRLVKKHGLPAMIHSIGHGIGLEVHEQPRLWGESKDSLRGAVLAIEPAAYFADFGVRYEEMVANVKGKWKKI